MNFSKLPSDDRLALGAGVVVVVTALLSLGNDWGAIMVLSLLAGAGVVAVVLQPFVAPATALPVTKGVAILGLGVVALVATSLAGLNWIEYIAEHLTRFDTLQFLVGLGAAGVMTWTGLVQQRSERASVAAPAA